MNTELKKMYPSALWDSFAAICSIPHPSKHEAKLLAYLKEWAEKNNIEYSQDKTGNLVFRKPATPGMENRVPVILQGHIDMVPQANSSKKHDFTIDPIEPMIGEDGWVRANGTTLGADNGMGCAAGMAVLLDKEIAHGPIEVLLTVDEETGMTGAFGLQAGMLNGRILLNLDSEDEGQLYVGCAGGLDAVFDFDYTMEDTPAHSAAFNVVISGLKGGHSGMDINLGRANANKLITRLLKNLFDKFNARLSSINGGGMRNAIPREAEALITLPMDKIADFKTFMNEFAQVLKAEFDVTEPDFTLNYSETNLPQQVMCNQSQRTLVNMLFAIPNGVLRMSDSMPNLVETSNNLAIVKSNGSSVQIANLLRSSVNSAKEALGEKMQAIAELSGSKLELLGAYPGWKPNMESPILKTAMKVYVDKFGCEPEIKAIHAGLECGLFGVCYPHWDMISFGPTIRHPHSPDEKVNIESVGKFWDFLTLILASIPSK